MFYNIVFHILVHIYWRGTKGQDYLSEVSDSSNNLISGV